MDPIYNNRIYAVIPPQIAHFYIHSKLDNSRLSLTGDFLIWDQAWDPKMIEKLKQDNLVRLITHKEALELMSTDDWKGAGPGGFNKTSYRDIVPV